MGGERSAVGRAKPSTRFQYPAAAACPAAARSV